MKEAKTSPTKISFEIAPRRARDGFTLTSSVLLYPLWYSTLNAAVSYARFVGRDRGCAIRILNANGETLDVIEIDERHNRRLKRPVQGVELRRAG